MRTLSDFKHLFEYDTWANRAAIASIKNLTSGRPRSVQLFSHLIETEILWHRRIILDYAHIKGVWNAWPLEKCEHEFNTILATWNELLENIAESNLQEQISYINTQGVAYTNTVEQILIHVINHSTYHRAQIATEVRKAGGEPASTDYIQYVR